MTLLKLINTSADNFMQKNNKNIKEESFMAMVQTSSQEIAELLARKMHFGLGIQAKTYKAVIFYIFSNNSHASKFNSNIRAIISSVENEMNNAPYTSDWLSILKDNRKGLLIRYKIVEGIALVNDARTYIDAKIEPLNAFHSSDIEKTHVKARSLTTKSDEIISSLSEFIATRIDGISVAQSTEYVTKLSQSLTLMLKKRSILDDFEVKRMISDLTEKNSVLLKSSITDERDCTLAQMAEFQESLVLAESITGEVNRTSYSLLADMGATTLCEMDITKIKASGNEDAFFDGFHVGIYYGMDNFDSSVSKAHFKHTSQYGSTMLQSLSNSIGSYLLSYLKVKRTAMLEQSLMELSTKLDTVVYIDELRNITESINDIECF
tara:strand:- start:2912 stop:4048 length:1137 start_codon:yes stop_codon:yes gene_type:complete